MKYNNIETIAIMISTQNPENVIFYSGKGSGFYKIDRMTNQYGNLPICCKLYKDFEKKGDGIYWLMQTCNCMKAEYSEEELLERNMYKEEAVTIKDGEEYLIVDMTKAPEFYEAVKVKAKVNGDYVTAAVFNEI